MCEGRRGLRAFVLAAPVPHLAMSSARLPLVAKPRSCKASISWSLFQRIIWLLLMPSDLRGVDRKGEGG